MKKLLLFGTFCLALSLGSCKTYCPAYNYAQDTQAKPKVSNTETSPVSNKVNS